MKEITLLRKIRSLREKVERALRLAEEVPSDPRARASLAAYAQDLERRAKELERQLTELRRAAERATRNDPPDDDS
ncbi:MAG: hypothetical protein ACM30I_01345 [Gemmatimonas sp.]